MADNEYVTMREGARRYRISDKKLQRAIRAEKLPARYPKPKDVRLRLLTWTGVLSRPHAPTPVNHAHKGDTPVVNSYKQSFPEGR